MTRDSANSTKAHRDQLRERMRKYGCTVSQIAVEVGEHLAPILHATSAEYRTVPIIGGTRSLHTLLTQRTDLTSSTLTTLRDDLAGFITHLAPTPPQLEAGTT